MMKVSAIHIYPIKGMQGSTVSGALALERGLENDRRYMLVDRNGHFISQRSHPILTQFRPYMEDGVHMEVQVGEEVISFEEGEHTSEKVNARLFEHHVVGSRVSDKMDQFFSDHLGEAVSLLKMTDDDVRHKTLLRGPAKSEVSFADGYPYLFAGSASLEKLNLKLDQPVPMDRFRPNIVIETREAHIEDEWIEISIGEAIFMVMKPCARCPVVTIDQSTGLRGKEPLRTLATYRKWDHKVFFGANAICLQNGRIRIGDEVVRRD